MAFTTGIVNVAERRICSAALAGDGITMDDLQRAARVVYESSPISSVKTWKSPVLLIHADDDRNVDFHQTVDLKQRLLAQGVAVDELVIPDDIHASCCGAAGEPSPAPRRPTWKNGCSR